MTRVNVEESVFGERRLFRFGDKMGWDRRQALGCLAFLWHDSQAQLRVDGTAEEIAEWCWSLDDVEGERIVHALLTAGYISALENGRYLIHGNETQIENILNRSTRATKGGKATKAKWDAVRAPSGVEQLQAHSKQASSRLQAGFKQASSLLQAGLKQASSVAGSLAPSLPVQGSAVQGSAEEYTPPILDPGDLDLAARWAEFARSVSKTVKPDVARWANTVRLMREKDGLTHGDIEAMLTFVKSDHFWQHNAVSLEGLRSRSKNGLRKYENVLNAAKERKPAQKPRPDIPVLTEADLEQLGN